MKTPGRDWETNVEIHWGKSGAGKTRFCYDNYERKEIYPIPKPFSGSVWFDGYMNHKVLLIDDFYGWLPLDFMLRLMDRYELRVPKKGGFIQMVCTHIHITSNSHWEKWYKWDTFDAELKNAFKRRITKVVEYPF